MNIVEPMTGDGSIVSTPIKFINKKLTIKYAIALYLCKVNKFNFGMSFSDLIRAS